MKKLLIFCVVLGVVFTISGLAHAENLFYTVYTPIDLADRDTFQNGRGEVPFGFDPDMPPPTGVFQPGPAGFGDSSYWSNLDDSARKYTSFRMSPRDIFRLTGDLTIGDLSYISYWTKNLDLTKIDWQIKIYTEGDDTKWYGYRFEFVRPTNPDSTNWYQSSTASLPVNKITSKWIGGADIPVTDNNNQLSKLASLYGDQKILFIDIIAGYNAVTLVNSLLDGVEIGLKSSDVATMDLAATTYYSCVGFEPPFSNKLTLKLKDKRAIPVKMRLFSGNNPITDQDVSAPPIVVVYYEQGISTIPGYDANLVPPGLSDDGNEFRYDPVAGLWIINLATKQFTAAGNYDVKVVAPAGSGYVVESTCRQTFERLP